MTELSMTFQVKLDRGITRHVTHLNGTDKNGINLYVCEFNDKNEQIKSVVNISVNEFKRNNAKLFADMIDRKENLNGTRN